MDYLIELGIDSSTIDEIIENNGSGIVLSFENNRENIINIINYFNDIGIFNIDELLIYETDVFLESFDSIKKRITKDLVNYINDDYIFVEKD